MYNIYKCNRCDRKIETDKESILKKQGWYVSKKICYCPEHNNKKERTNDKNS